MFLLCKHFMHSSVLTQPPTLLLPAARLQRVSGLPSKLLPRNTLSERQLKEFRKTARLISQPPWSLQRGCEYLQGMCDDNQSGREHQPPEIKYFNTSPEALGVLQAQRAAAGPPPDLVNFAPGTPRKVVVRIRPPREAEPGQEDRGRGRGRGRRGRGKGRGKGAGKQGDGEAANVDGEVAGGAIPAAAARDGDPEVEVPEDVAPEPAAPAAEVADPANGRRRLANFVAGPSGKRYRQSTVDQQSQLGCNKCKFAVGGCSRCKDIHEAWKSQHPAA